MLGGVEPILRRRELRVDFFLPLSNDLSPSALPLIFVEKYFILLCRLFRAFSPCNSILPERMRKHSLGPNVVNMTSGVVCFYSRM